MFLLMAAAAANLMTLPGIEAAALKPDFQARFNEGGAAGIQVRVVVSPRGEIIRCERGFVNGPAQNADAFCSMIQRRARFRPARDASGQVAYGTIHLWSHWQNRRWSGSAVPSWNPVDLAFTTNRLPKEFGEAAMFPLAIYVEPRGAVSKCGVVTMKIAQELVDVLCREAAASPIAPTTDELGNPVPSVQEFMVRVTTQAARDKMMERIRKR